MKTINLFIFSLFLSSTLLTGCMPDSLTQFKKDPPAKPKSVTGVPVTDSSGKAIDPSTIVYPVLFQYQLETDSAPKTQFPLEINKRYIIKAVFDGSFTKGDVRAAMITRCEIDQAGSTVSRTLPNGLQINDKSCGLFGTPLTIYSDLPPSTTGGLIRYKINVYYKDAKNLCPGDECVLSSEIDLAAYAKPSNLALTQNDVLEVGISPTGSFTFTENDSSVMTRTDVLTSNNKAMGQIEIANATDNILSIYKAVPLTVSSASISGFSAGAAVSTGTKTGTVISVDSTNNIIRVVRNLSSASFTTGDTITSPVNTSISAIDSTEAFRIGDKVDSDTQYYSERAKLRTVTQIYPVGTTIDNITVIPHSTQVAANGITYSISPAPPGGLSFNTSTGTISGQFTEPFPRATFTITSTNAIGSTSTDVTIESYYPPEDLSYVNGQLFAVINSNPTNPNSVFIEGERVFRPKLATESSPVTGRIIRKISTNRLQVFTQNGAYDLSNSIDSGKRFFSEKAQIDPNVAISDFNIILKLADITNFATGDYISTSAGAKGRVLDRDTASNTLFVQFLTPNTSSVVYFNQGDGVDDAATWVANESTVSAVEAQNYVLTLADASAVTTGDDLTGKNPLAAEFVGGYVNNKSGNTLYISDTTRRGDNYWKNTFEIDAADAVNKNGERFIAANTTISNVSHDNAYYFETKLPTEIRAKLSRGSATFSIDKALPLGLSLNAITGKITGSPSALTPRKTYIIKAKNLLGSSSYKFDIEVRDFFKISDTNTDASSFQLHKTGMTQNVRGCRINAKDILDGNANALDIRCYLDGQEEDLYFEKLKIQPVVGGGICQYVQYAPYYFNKFKPGKTAKSIDYVAENACTHGGLPAGYVRSQAAADICDYYYNDTYNCDEGEVSVTTHTTTLDTNTMICSTTGTSTAIVKCNGKKVRCIEGAIKDTITSESELEKGMRSVIYNTSSGDTVPPFTHSSPQSKLDLSNLRIANNNDANFCSNSNSDTGTWASSATSYGALSSYVMPFAGGAATDSPREYGQPFYVFNCLDAAKDIKARIRLIVRDWDKSFTIADNIDYDTNLDGANSKKDDHTLSGFGSSYNSYLDWDDDMNDSDGDGNYYEASPHVNYSGSCASVTTNPDGGGLDCYSSDGVQDATITTQKACLKANKKWRPGSHYQFPGDNL